MQHSLNSNQQPASNNAYMNPASYSGDMRQPSQSQYASSSYDWNKRGTQPSPTYADTLRQSHYQTDSLRQGSAHKGSHQNQIQSRQYATEVAAGSATNNHYNSAAPNTQRLKHHGYASGLDSANVHGTVQHGRRESLTNGSQYHTQPITNTSQRVQSPVSQTGNQYGAGHSMNYPDNDEPPPVAAPQAPFPAATALVGAVNRRYHQSSASTGQPSVSPLMDHSRSSISAPQRTESPYIHVPATVMDRPQPNNHPQSRYASSSHLNGDSGSNRPQSMQNQNQTIRQQTATPPVKQNSHPVNRISTLITRTDADENSQPQYATANERQGEMPGYIDPTQVFNPFHKEHEQRKREVARADAQAAAQRKAEADAQAAAKKKAEDEAEAARQVKADQAASAQARAEEMARPAKKAANKRQSEPQAQTANSAVAQASLTSEEEMALEMKVMMEKMKDFRSKDPSMFQKLWDNMRGIPSPAIPSAAPVQLSPPQVNQQPPQPQPQPQPTPPPQSTAAPTSIGPLSVASGTPGPRNPAPRSAPIALNGYRVVVENNPENLPDLGRFPAERRVRGSYGKKNGPGTPSGQGTTANVGREGADAAPTAAPASDTGLNVSGPSSLSAAGKVPAQALVPVSTPTATGKAKPAPSVDLSRGTIWPEDKRNALAAAAVNCLREFAHKGYPGNANIEITPMDIHAILEGNPSYVDLCEILEQKGFRFHRGQLARQLLVNVPFLNGAPAPPKQQSTPPVTQATSQATAVGGQPTPVPAPSGGHVQPAPVSSAHPMTTNPVQPVIRFLPVPPPAQLRKLNNEQPTIKPEGRVPHTQQSGPHPRHPRGQKFVPTRPEPPVGSKEAMARKRDLSELIDLTGLSDNDDYVLSKKQARVMRSPPATDVFPDYQTPMMPGAPVSMHQTFLSGPTHAAEPLRFHPGPQPGPPPPGSRDFQLPRENIPSRAPTKPVVRRDFGYVKPINRAEGLKKASCDPKTVARDVLIASGRHPTERPLNAHMAGLLGRHIYIDSDLATFDWDAIDPGGPPMPQVEYADVAAKSPQYQFVQRVERGPQVRDPVSNGESGGSRQGMTGRRSRSDKHLAKARLSNREFVPFVPAPAPSTALPPPSSPSSMASNSLVEASNSVVRRLSALRQSQSSGSAPGVSKDPDRSSPQVSSNRPARGTNNTMVSHEAAVQPPGPRRGRPPGPTGKRIGRPPGSKNKTMSISAMQKAARQVTSVTLPSPSPSTSYLPIFKCRWKRCSAHLHNSETLHQHILKVHGQPEENIGDYACWWRKCRFLKEDSEGMWQPVKTFPLLKDWIEHVDQDHIYPITRKQGDGPSTRHTGKPKESPYDLSRFRFVPPCASKTRTFSYLDPQTILTDKIRYLADENGQTTTPIISAQHNADLKPDTMALLAAEHDDSSAGAQRSFLKTHRDDKRIGPKAIAEETLRSLMHIKANFGPGMGNEGCVLVRESVKSRLAQNPAIVRVTEADD